MKFYNPFKPHIVEHANGKFAVRKCCIIGWVYKDRKSWVSTYGKALEVMHMKVPNKKDPNEVVEVYYG